MTDTFTCKFCKQPFPFAAIDGFPFRLTPTVCDPCDDRLRLQQAAEVEAAAIARWESMLPFTCRDTDRNHPHMPSPSKQAKIVEWNGHRSLILYGAPRKGKTRLAWLILKRMMIQGKEVEATTSIALTDAIAAMWSAGAEHISWYKDRLVDADVLLIDDLGKCKLTERAEADVFDIFDRRFSAGRPVIVTTNFVGDTLAAKFSPDRGPAFVARLREFCDCICV